MVEKIKIGDTEYLVKDNPELLKFAESIRKEEKEKLHGEIALQKSKVVELQGKLDGSKQADEELKKAQEQLEKLKGEKLIAENDVKRMNEQLEELKNGKQDPPSESGKGGKKSGNDELLNAMKGILEENNKKFDSTIEELQKKVEAANNIVSGLTVKQHREKLLAEHKGNIIPEFLTGSTIEELDKMLPTALQNSKKYITVKDDDGKVITLAELEKAKKSGEEEPGAGTPANPLADLLKQFKVEPPASGSETEPKVEDIKKMSSEEFNKNKDAIKEQLKAEMEQSKK